MNGFPASAYRLGLAVLLLSGTSCSWIGRASLGNGGVQGNDHSHMGSHQTVSDDGRYVTFSSSATNLVSGDTNGSEDIFVRDLVAGTTIRVNLDNDGNQTPPLCELSCSHGPAISGNGRFVAFESWSYALTDEPRSGEVELYLRNLSAGTTTLISVGDEGLELYIEAQSTSAKLSDDGRYVAFTSSATNLVPGNTNGTGQDVFVRDTLTNTTTALSYGVLPNTVSFVLSMSGDGRYVLFFSETRLVPEDTDAFGDIYVRDMVAGTTTRVSVADNEDPPDADSFGSGMISGDGRYALFGSFATNLVPGPDTGGDIYKRDLLLGTTTRVRLGDDEPFDEPVQHPPCCYIWASDDLRYVGFSTPADNVVPGDTNSTFDSFVRDTVAGITTRVSVSAFGRQANDQSSYAALSSDGRYIAFGSLASNLVRDDTNNVIDVYVRYWIQPNIIDVEPSTVARGTSATLTIHGDRFLSPNHVVVEGQGVSVTSVTWVSESELSVDVNVASDAATGSRGVAVVNQGLTNDIRSVGGCRSGACLSVS